MVYIIFSGVMLLLLWYWLGYNIFFCSYFVSFHRIRNFAHTSPSEGDLRAKIVLSIGYSDCWPAYMEYHLHYAADFLL